MDYRYRHHHNADAEGKEPGDEFRVLITVFAFRLQSGMALRSSGKESQLQFLTPRLVCRRFIMATFRRHEKHILSSLHPYVSGLIPRALSAFSSSSCCDVSLTLKGFKAHPYWTPSAPGQLRCPSRRATLR